MKKHIYLWAALAALCACSVEPVTEGPDVSGETVILEAGFEGDAETRTERQPNGKVFWLPGNEVGLFRGAATGGGSRFTTHITEPSAQASFEGKGVNGSGYYWALYPYNPNSYYDSTYGLVTELPAEQDGVAGTFADNLFISVGYARSLSMTFYHLCGGVKFTVTEPDICRATLVADGAVLAGVVAIKMKSSRPSVYAYADPVDSIDLYPEDGTFIPGEAYHFVTLPADLSGGFSLVFEKEDGSIAVKTVSKAVSIKRGHFAVLESADKGLSWSHDLLEYTPDEVTVDPIGGAFSITVKSYGDYHVDVSESWIHPAGVTGNPITGAVHTFFVDRNTGDERMAVVTVCNDSNCFPVMVSQGNGNGLKAIAHHSLGMRFTATWCGWCPYMNESFAKAKEQLDDRFEIVNLHASDSDLAFSGTNTLGNQYRVDGYPTGMVDGRIAVGNSTDTDAVAAGIATIVGETEGYYPVVTSVGLSSTLSGGKLSLDAEVFTMVPGEYKLTVFLLESGIVNRQASYAINAYISDYVHDNIARLSLTDVLGDAFTTTEANATRTFHYEADVPSTYNTAHLSVLAFVQRTYGELPVIRTDDYGDYFIDNCRIVPVGTSVAPEVSD